MVLSGCFLGLTGCEDQILDAEPRDQLPIDVVFSNLDGIEAATLGMYERGRFIYSSNDVGMYKLFYTDIIASGTHITDQATWNQMATFQNFDAQNAGISTIWNGYYRGLFLANSIIENIGLLEIDEGIASQITRRNTALGEAYYFRAYFHLNLVEYWDNIFLADRVFTNLSDPDAKLELAGRAAVYGLIVEDLETAIGLLPEATEVISRGKASKGVARHLLSLAYMDIGSYSIEGFDDPFGEAATLAEAVITDPAYALLPVSQLNEVFSVANQENSEIIFAWQFNEAAPADPRQRLSQQLVPLYDRINGVARTFEQGGRPWGRMIPSTYYWTLFEDDDPRLAAWHKLVWTYDVDTEEDPLPEGVSIGDVVTAENMEETTGLGARLIEPTTTKYWENDELGRTIDDAEGFRNIIQFRVAEAYLIAAEAHMKAGSAGLGQQRFDDLREARDMATLPLTIDNLVEEQARELGFEGRRYPMLKRLGILEERVDAGSPQIGQNMLSHHVRWPIPLEEVRLNQVEQNPSYE